MKGCLTLLCGRFPGRSPSPIGPSGISPERLRIGYFPYVTAAEVSPPDPAVGLLEQHLVELGEHCAEAGEIERPLLLGAAAAVQVVSP